MLINTKLLDLEKLSSNFWDGLLETDRNTNRKIILNTIKSFNLAENNIR